MSSNKKKPCQHCGVRFRGGFAACPMCRQRLGLGLTPDDELTGGEWVLKGSVRVYVRPPEPEQPEHSPATENSGYQCGTVRAYSKHLRMKQIACEDCLAAVRIYQRMRRYGRTHTLTLEAQHGTYSGYNRHTRTREKPCDECAEAARTYYREYRAKARAKAKSVDRPGTAMETQSRVSRATGRIKTSPESAPTPIRGLTRTNRSDRSEGSMESTYSHPHDAISSEVA